MLRPAVICALHGGLSQVERWQVCPPGSCARAPPATGVWVLAAEPLLVLVMSRTQDTQRPARRPPQARIGAPLGCWDAALPSGVLRSPLPPLGIPVPRCGRPGNLVRHGPSCVPCL